MKTIGEESESDESASEIGPGLEKKWRERSSINKMEISMRA